MTGLTVLRGGEAITCTEAVLVLNFNGTETDRKVLDIMTSK